jgi:hypothetical protein
MRWALTTGSIIALALCISLQAQQRAVIRSDDPPDENPQYFPTGVFSEFPDLSDFTARWYAKHLRAMAEPSLFKAAKDKKLVAYRFLWLRTFHHPISIRLNIRPTDTAYLTTIVTSGGGGYAPGIISSNDVIEISPEQLNQFSSQLDQAQFWSMQASEKTRNGFDGAEWILEGVKDGNYHIVSRWSPKSGSYRELCLGLVKLSNLALKPKEIY